MKALAAFACLFGILCTAHGSDWTRWRGPEGRGISTEKFNPEALKSGPKIKWKANLGVGHSSVSVAGKRLYTMGNQGGEDVVYCLDAETGREVWRYGYRCRPGNYSGPRATPVLDGDLLYTLSRDGHAYCLDAQTGRVKWRVDLVRTLRATSVSWGLAGSPLVVGNAVVYNARAHGVALDKTSGRKIWVSGGGEGGYATPVHFTHKGKECAAFFSAREVVVVDLSNGRKLTSYPWTTSYNVNAADPVYFDDKLFITSGYGRGCALLDLSGRRARKLWENKNMRSHFSSPIYLDGHLYGVDGNTGSGQLRCLDAATGRVKWSNRDGRFENLMVADGKILAIDMSGVLHVIEAKPAYKELAKATVLSRGPKNWTAPVLANGLIYCRNSNGTLVAVDVR